MSPYNMGKKELPRIPMWVRIETGHDSRLIDITVLKSQLEEEGIPVQVSKPWHPSYTTGLECVFEFFANLRFDDIIISGIVFDAFKNAVVKVWNCLKLFAKKNDSINFEPTIIIRLDDVTIVFYGDEFKSINRQTEVFDRIAYHIRQMSSQGLHGIDIIEIPCLPCYLPDNENEVYDKTLWRVRYGAREYAYYNPSTKQLL